MQDLDTALATSVDTMERDEYIFRGMTRPLRFHQLIPILMIIQGIPAGRDGFLMADGMGLGKT